MKFYGPKKINQSFIFHSFKSLFVCVCVCFYYIEFNSLVNWIDIGWNIRKNIFFFLFINEITLRLKQIWFRILPFEKFFPSFFALLLAPVCVCYPMPCFTPLPGMFWFRFSLKNFQFPNDVVETTWKWKKILCSTSIPGPIGMIFLFRFNKFFFSLGSMVGSRRIFFLTE